MDNTLISIDVGYGNTKYYTDGKAGAFPSIYKVYNGESYTPKNKEDMLLEIDGQKYLVGETALNRSGEADFDKNSSLRHKLFILAAICKGIPKKVESIEIAVGLPIGDMKALSRMLSDLQGTYDFKYNNVKRKIDIDKVHIFAQGEAIIKLLEAQDESINGEHVGIIDIGQKTVDYALFRYGSYVEEYSGSLDWGINNAWTDIARSIARNLNVDEPEQYMVKKELERYRNQKKDGIDKVNADVDETLKNLASSIRNRLYSNHWNFNSLDKLYIVGGGAYLLQKYFEDAPLQKFDYPLEHANAVAFYEGV